MCVGIQKRKVSLNEGAIQGMNFGNMLDERNPLQRDVHSFCPLVNTHPHTHSSPHHQLYNQGLILVVFVEGIASPLSYQWIGTWQDVQVEF